MQETFGQYLKDLRNQKGFTLSELATKLQMHSANLSKVENGKREFDTKRLPKLCKVFNLDIAEMERELIGEQFARSVYEKKLDPTVLTLAEQKVKYFTKSKEYNESDALSIIEEVMIPFES